jgi:hypothetical protein
MVDLINIMDKIKPSMKVIYWIKINSNTTNNNKFTTIFLKTETSLSF